MRPIKVNKQKNEAVADISLYELFYIYIFKSTFLDKMS